jgi:dTDP-4-dehydrorhamnose reductase
MKSILITGSSGVLGWHLCRFFSQIDYQVRGTYRQHLPDLQAVHFDYLALEDFDSIDQYFEQNRFDIVVHSAAVTNPDDCEKQPDFARRVNHGATRYLTNILPDETLMVYISTDLVFDGEKGNYREDDLPRPVNLYGETKLLAEEEVCQRGNSVVLRVAKLFSTESPFSSSFESWMREKFEQGLEIPLFRDQFRTPLYVGDVAHAILRLATKSHQNNLYHLGGGERVSRLEFGQRFAQTCGFDSSLIKSTSASELGLVMRGKDCSLNSQRFCEEFDFVPSSLEIGFRKMLSGDY